MLRVWNFFVGFGMTINNGFDIKMEMNNVNFELHHVNIHEEYKWKFVDLFLTETM